MFRIYNTWYLRNVLRKLDLVSVAQWSRELFRRPPKDSVMYVYWFLLINDFFFRKLRLTVVPFIVANSFFYLFIRYQIMLKCWEKNPSNRPTFAKLKETMKEMERNHRVRMGYQLVTIQYLILFPLTTMGEKFRFIVLFNDFCLFCLAYPILSEWRDHLYMSCNFYNESLIIVSAAFLLQTYVNLNQYDTAFYSKVEDLTAE